MSSELQALWADDDAPKSTEVLEAVPQRKLERRLLKWTELGGDELEQPLQTGLVKLVRATWLIELAKHGGTLKRRQELPQKAFVGLEELQAAGPFEDDFKGYRWLRVIVLSYPWLQPGHPDRYGENLCIIAKALEAYVNWHRGRHLYGVLIDFTALFQDDRTEEEKKLFKLALPTLNLFYSHRHTVVLKVTKFPAGYPKGGAHQYELPKEANTVIYDKRGWCFAESAMSGLVKPSDQVLDLGRLPTNNNLDDFIQCCKSGRAPPLHPDIFKKELQEKTFTCKKDDFEKVAKLYADAFQHRLGNALFLDYNGLGWGPDETEKLVEALRGSKGLRDLNLWGNRVDGQAAVALAEALRLRSNDVLRTLNLGRNSLGAKGVVALAEALGDNEGLRDLNLQGNSVGEQGTAALAEALRNNKTLQRLYLTSAEVGEQGRSALAEAEAAGRVIYDY